ncbi:MAG: glycosyltransferase [Hyphomicrobiaceae bacterium]|nr:glycosyltransferase [Hyphomicrobiaceae bacterium]
MCFVLVSLVPNQIWDADSRTFVYTMGAIGIWRYSWWFNHWIRAIIYAKITYPRIRRRADELWESGWRPRRVHFQMTTFREERTTAEAVVRSICEQIRDIGRPATVWIGSSEPDDERTLIRHFELVGDDLDIELRIIRQNQPGKRVAIALILRAMSREGLGPEDMVAFMDGDFILDKHALARCLSLFATDPDLHAVTTDEDVVVVGPGWLQSWLSMRFAQRRLAMQSHALSNRVLTLTGRFSVFRATHIVSNDFIRLQEADFLDHWLWGRFRFLSGDDKSSWYALLKHNVKMLYVPDARGYTVEIIEGSGRQRMVENLRRWSGNMLRNGQRAISLGPWRMPVFIWWCCVDQRLAIWTMLFSPFLAIAATMKIGASFIAAYIAYVAVTRGLLSLVLFIYSRRVDMNYIWALYANQLVNALVKVYMMWRLAKQKWANRGNQKQSASGDGWAATAREWMAAYLTAFSFASLFLVVMIYSKLLVVPSFDAIRMMFGA